MIRRWLLVLYSHKACFSTNQSAHYIWTLLRSMLGERNTILGPLWYSVGFFLVLKGDLLWYSFRLTSAFSAPSWIVFLVGTKMLNTHYLFDMQSLQWLPGAMDSAFPSHVWGLGFDSCRVRLFSFFCSCFVLFVSF